jgi:hypothetical protein
MSVPISPLGEYVVVQNEEATAPKAVCLYQNQLPKSRAPPKSWLGPKANSKSRR